MIHNIHFPTSLPSVASLRSTENFDFETSGDSLVVKCTCTPPHPPVPPGYPAKITDSSVDMENVSKFSGFRSDFPTSLLSTHSRFGNLTQETTLETTRKEIDKAPYIVQSYPAQDFRSQSREHRNLDHSQRQHGYCNNCGKYGHSFHQCKMPITSYGLVVFRKRTDNEIEYLMICRRDTLGFIDFMRGKYSIYNKEYILNMVVQMTDQEKTRLLTKSFTEIWSDLWGNEAILDQYRAEEHISREKHASLQRGVVLKDDHYTLESLIRGTFASPSWQVAEWGFPKGRRNYQEKDYECAVREFCEETGYPESALMPIQNLHPFEEIFTGSNYKSYKHKYYLTWMSYTESLQECTVQSSEVSQAEWKTYDECLSSIRPYNMEKKRVLENVHSTLTEYGLC